MTWWENWGLDQELFSNGLIRLHCTLSNLWAPNFNWEILDDMQAEKKKHQAPIPHFSSHISKIVYSDDYRCLILVFSVIYLVSWGYIEWGPRPGIWKVSFPLSFFFSFLPSFFFFFFVSFLGPLWLRGPWTLSIHATQSLRHWKSA